MPDWTLIRDRDGNKYFFDKNGKIWTSGKPEFEYKAVSIEGLDYYLNQAIELIRSHYKTDGLALLKSIMAMPIINNRIFEAQSRASKEINHLIKKEGGRYNRLNNNASILIFKEDGLTTLTNDRMLYSIRIPDRFKIINRKIRERPDYIYYGVSIALNLKGQDIVKKNKYSKYDLILAIDSEKFPYPIRSIKKIEANWKRNLGADTFERNIIEASENKIVYSYKDKFSPFYMGFEGIYFKGNYSYYIRIICGRLTFQNYKKDIAIILKRFKI